MARDAAEQDRVAGWLSETVTIAASDRKRQANRRPAPVFLAPRGAPIAVQPARRGDREKARLRQVLAKGLERGKRSGATAPQ